MNDNNHKIQQILNFLEKEPNDCFLLHALALEHLKLDNVQEAQNLFTKVINIDPLYVGTYYHLGRTWEILQQNDKAIEVYEEGIKMAQQKGDKHALNELRSAIDILME